MELKLQQSKMNEMGTLVLGARCLAGELVFHSLSRQYIIFFFFLFLSFLCVMYINVYIHVCTCMCVFVCMWRLLVDTECLPQLCSILLLRQCL